MEGFDCELPLLQSERTVDSYRTVALCNGSSTISGASLAFLSQLILTKVLWTAEIMTQDMVHVVLFCLLWSVLTCMFIFLGMCGFVSAVSTAVGPLTEDRRFQMEAYHVAGAIVSVMLVWVMKDMILVDSAFLHHHRNLIVVVVLAAYVLHIVGLALWTFQNFHQKRRIRGVQDMEKDNTPLQATLRMISSLLGLVVGGSNQILLYVVLWCYVLLDQVTSRPEIVAMFWFLATLVSISLGWLALPLLADSQPNHHKLQELRNTYILSNAVGIGFVWFFLKVMVPDAVQYLSCLVTSLAAVLVAWQYHRKYGFDKEESLQLSLLSEQEIVGFRYEQIRSTPVTN